MQTTGQETSRGLAMSPEMRTILHAAVSDLNRQRRSADAKVKRASEARRALPVGSSRAKITTANARYMTACEARDRIDRALIHAHDLLNAARRAS